MHDGKLCFFATVHWLVHYISVNIKSNIFSQFNSIWSVGILSHNWFISYIQLNDQSSILSKILSSILKKKNYTLVLEMNVNWYSTVHTTVSGFMNSSELRKMLGSIQGVPV